MEPPHRQLAEERRELAGDVEMRVEGPADALDGHQRPDQQDQVGRDVQVVGADEADQLAEQRPEVDRLEVELGVGGDQLGDVAAEAAGVQ